MPHTEPRPQAALYIRTIVDRAGTTAEVDQQRAPYIALIEQNGWELAGEYIDDTSSGGDRHEYRRLVEDVKAGKVDHVVSPALNHLATKPAEANDWLDLSEKYDVTIYTVEGAES